MAVRAETEGILSSAHRALVERGALAWIRDNNDREAWGIVSLTERAIGLVCAAGAGVISSLVPTGDTTQIRNQYVLGVEAAYIAALTERAE